MAEHSRSAAGKREWLGKEERGTAWLGEDQWRSVGLGESTFWLWCVLFQSRPA